MAASPALAEDAASVSESAPSEAQALALTTGLLDATVSGVLPDWLGVHARLSAADGAAWTTLLTTDTHTARLLAAQPGVLDTQAAPTYRRVVLDTVPPLTLVVRSDDQGAYVHAIEATTCSSCTEPERFLRDLVATVRITGGEHRLMPGVELYVGPKLSRVPGNRDTRWVAAWMAQRGGAHLQDRLDGVVLTRTGTGRFQATWPDGTVDTWEVVWSEDRWMLDYDRLSEESPLRLSPSEARTRRTVESWQPILRPQGDALLLGRQVMGAGIEPLTDAVWLLVLDVDGSRPEAVLVDPTLQEVTRRIALGDLDVQPDVSERWFDSRRTAVSPHAQRLAVALPHRVIEATTSPGQSRRIGGLSVSALHSTDAGTWVAQEDGTLRGPEPRIYRHDTGFVAIDPDSGVGVRSDARIALLTRPDATPSAPVCAGPAIGAGISPDGSTWAIQCAGDAPGLNFVSQDSGPLYAVRLPAGTTGAVAWSPDGTAVAVASGTDDELVMVFDDGDVEHTGIEDVRQIVWSHDADHVVTVHSDGAARWWPAAVLR